MEFTVTDLPEEESIASQCEEVAGFFVNGLVRVSPSNCVLPKYFPNKMEEIRNFKVRDDDVFLISNPKCGTTWSMEMTWLIANNLDFEGAKKDLDERFPYLDIDACVPTMSMLEKYNELPSPRFFKSHLPKELLPKEIWNSKCKIIFIVRDPKDAAVSNYHHYKTFHAYNGTLEQYLDHYVQDRVVYSPFWEHAIEFWKIRDQPRVLFLTYEEMKADLPAVMKKVAQFLGKTLTEEDIGKLQDHLSLENMRNNRAVNYEKLKEFLKSIGRKVGTENFMRSGKTGGGKEAMSPKTAQKFAEWTKRKIGGTGLDALYC